MAASVSLPRVGEKPWFALRAKAATAPSTKFTASTIAALLSMSGEKSANDNVLHGLRRLGIIDDDGSLTDRGNKWRVDASYPEACDEILASVYPSDLLTLTDDDGEPDRSKVTTWLQHKGQGESAAKQMASTFTMIASKSPAPAPTPASAGAKPSSPKPRASKASAAASKGVGDGNASDVGSSDQNASGGGDPSPTIHLDIQVHIPPAASAEQIDQIFASMAKHLYRR